MKRIGILYLIDKLETGGTQRHLVGLARSIDRTVFEPRVACLMSEGALADELRADGVEVRCLNLRRIYGPRAAAAAFRAANFVFESRIPIVHSYLFSANLFGAALRALSGAKLVISKRDLGFENTPLKKLASRLPARFADVVTANSRAVERHLVEDEKIPREKIRVIYNGVEVADGAAQVEEAREALLRTNWSPHRATVGTVANLKAVKNHRALLYAARRVLAQCDAAQFLFVGDGPERKRLERLAEELGVRERVIFFGESRLVSGLNRHIDIFVLPSLHEGFPNAVLEAMAAGRPVIATERGGCGEAVAHGVSGFLFDPENAPELARRIILLLKDPELRAAMGRAAMNDAREKFSMKRMVDEHERLYISLVGGLRRRAEAREATYVERSEACYFMSGA